MSLLTVVVLVTTFFGLKPSVTKDIGAKIDSSLKDQYEDLKQTRLEQAHTPQQLKDTMNQYVAEQGVSDQARIVLFDFTDGTQITDDPNLTNGKADALKTSRLFLKTTKGLSTVDIPEVGEFRVYNRPVERNGQVVAICIFAGSLAVLNQAGGSIDKAFLIVSLLTVLLSVALSALIAQRVSKPIQGITKIAAQIGADRMTKRVNYRGPSTEVATLSSAFNRMMGRLEDAFNRQREFVDNASHELRTPLTVLRGQIELLSRDKAMSNTDRDRSVDSLLREIDIMNRLVDDMLTLAKLDSGKLVVTQPTDLKGFIADFKRDIELFGNRSYNVQSNVKGSANIDPERVAQVLRNLVTNAVNHTEEGGKISVDFHAENDTLLVTVQDDGPGIPTDQLESIFDRFQRTDESRNRIDGGSGLGLAIAKSIVEAHNGKIWAQQQEGQGATFKFTLPLS